VSNGVMRWNASRVFIAALILTGCVRAPRPVSAPAPVDRGQEVVRLLNAGCYVCLREAMALIDAGHAVERRFDVLALLASRVRELGIRDEIDWQALAATAAPPEDPRAAVILVLAEQARQPQGGRVFGQPDLSHARREEIAQAVLTLWPTAPDDPVDRFFYLSARCVGLVRGDPSQEAESRTAESPLLGYRRATCGHIEADAFASLKAAEPRFAEVHYFAAVAALNAGALITTERELDAFEPGFPRASAAAFLRGQVLLALEEFEEAADAFARVLAVMPSMPDALLYHMRAESHVDPARGEAAANRLVALGTWHQGEAYYWRAWNRRALGRLDEAAADIQTAKQVIYNAAVPKLAGFIAYDRGDLPLAETELHESLSRDASDCEVQFALGQVLARTRRWSAAGDRFISVIACTRGAQDALARRMVEIRDGALDPARRARLEARVQRHRDVERSREGLATFGAASALALSGRTGEARPLAEAATSWPDLRPRAEQLLAQLPSPRP
jgi:tetratricopeptide (TPR) repeat protein